MNSFGVVLLHNTSAVMRVEKVLDRSGLACRLIPTPRQLSSDCGMAVRFAWKDMERVLAALDEAHVEVVGIHPL